MASIPIYEEINLDHHHTCLLLLLCLFDIWPLNLYRYRPFPRQLPGNWSSFTRRKKAQIRFGDALAVDFQLKEFVLVILFWQDCLFLEIHFVSCFGVCGRAEWSMSRDRDGLWRTFVQGTLRFNSFHAKESHHPLKNHPCLVVQRSRSIENLLLSRKDAFIPGGHTVLDSYIPHILQFAAGSKSVPWCATGKKMDGRCETWCIDDFDLARKKTSLWKVGLVGGILH